MALFTIDTEEETLQQRLAKLGNAPVLTPMGAQLAGANPNQAKMAGVPIRKQQVLQQAAAPKQQTLSGASRLQQPGAGGPTQEQQQAQERAAQLGQLGTLSGRVQELVNARSQAELQATEYGATGVNEKALQQLFGLEQGDTTPQFEAARDSLMKLSLASTPTEREQALYELASIPELQGADASAYLNLDIDQSAVEAAKAISDTVVLGDFEVKNLGFDSWEALRAAVAPNRAVADIQQLTLTDLQGIVKSIQEQAYLKVQSLQARLAAAVPGSVQAQVLQRQLRDIEEVGVRGVEQDVAELAEDINMANIIEINGQEYTVEQLLKDSAMSERIIAYLQESDPEQRDQIMPPDMFGAVRDWVDKNKIALADVKNDTKLAQTAFAELQEDYQSIPNLTEDFKLTTGFTDKLFKALGIEDGWDPNRPVTTAMYEQLKQALSGSVLGELIGTPEQPGYDNFTGFLATLQANPDWLETVLARDEAGNFTYTKDQLIAGFETAETLTALQLPTKALQEWFGIDEIDPFVLDSGLLDIMNEKLPLVERIYEEQSAWLLDDSLSTLDSDTLSYLLDHPDEYQDYTALRDYNEELAGVDTLDEALDFAFGVDVTPAMVAEWNTNYAMVRKLAMLGDAGAIEALKTYRFFDRNGDGSIDAGDLPSLLEHFKAQAPSLNDFDALNAAGSRAFDPAALGIRDKYNTIEYAGSSDEIINVATKLINEQNKVSADIGTITDSLNMYITGDYNKFSQLLNILENAGFSYQDYVDYRVKQQNDTTAYDTAQVMKQIDPTDYDELASPVYKNFDLPLNKLTRKLEAIKTTLKGKADVVKALANEIRSKLAGSPSPGLKRDLEIQLAAAKAQWQTIVDQYNGVKTRYAALTKKLDTQTEWSPKQQKAAFGDTLSSLYNQIYAASANSKGISNHNNANNFLAEIKSKTAGEIQEIVNRWQGWIKANLKGKTLTEAQVKEEMGG